MHTGHVKKNAFKNKIRDSNRCGSGWRHPELTLISLEGNRHFLMPIDRTWQDAKTEILQDVLTLAGNFDILRLLVFRGGLPG